MFALTLGAATAVGNHATFTRRRIKRPAGLRPPAITLRQVGLHAVGPSWRTSPLSLSLPLSLCAFYVPTELNSTGLAVELHRGPGEGVHSLAADVEAGAPRVEARIGHGRLAQSRDVILRRPHGGAGRCERNVRRADRSHFLLVISTSPTRCHFISSFRADALTNPDPVWRRPLVMFSTFRR